MLKLAFLIGFFCYTIFLLGTLGLLYKQIVIIVGIFYFVLGISYFLKNKVRKINLREIPNLSKFLIVLIVVEATINFIGVLGPELSFDALWYHLTLPKLFLESHKIFHIPGGILYYSDMPKNIEMIYVLALSIGNEITAKFFHFLFGILSILALYKLSRRFFDQNLSLLSVIVFYSSLVVGWLSISAYIDLGTTFFAILSVNEFLNWVDKKNDKHLLYFAILVGLSVSTKITLLISLPIFILLIFLVSKNSNSNTKNTIKNIFQFTLVSSLVSVPWLIFSYFNTGNPFFPLFSKGFSFAYDLSFVSVLKQAVFPSDPINPLYLIVLPLLFIFYNKFSKNLKFLFIYVILALVTWIFLAPIGGSRLLLPFLPVFSILVVSCIFYLKSKLAKKYLVMLILLIAVSSIFYRFFANLKYIPVILGTETKEEFLTNNLNFSYGDFYDTDNFFKNNIKSSDKVLTYGFHNLYYVDFPFVDSSFIQKGDRFNYIATKNSSLPEKFYSFKQIHYNTKTGVRVYSDGGKMWEN